MTCLPALRIVFPAEFPQETLRKIRWSSAPDRRIVQRLHFRSKK
jgi:hypothetical protein